MMDYGWHDGGWGVVWMILSLGIVIAVVWVAIRAFAGEDRRHDRSRDAKDVLAERFAEGEIDAEEYHERLRVLEGTREPTPGAPR